MRRVDLGEIGRGAEVPKQYFNIIGRVPAGAWNRWGAQSGNVAVSFRKKKVSGVPGHRPGHPDRVAETLREQLWATAGTLKVVGPRF